MGRNRIEVAGLVAGLFVVLEGAAGAQMTQRLSLSYGGSQPNGASGYPYGHSISDDGRFVAFGSVASNLVPGDLNALCDVFVRDRRLGGTEIVSVGLGGAWGIGWSDSPSISGNGRYVAFQSTAPNLVAADTNGAFDVFVRDRQTETTERVSRGSAGVQANDHSYAPAISANGRFVAFWSEASNLVPGDGNGRADVFVRDRQTGTTERVSVSSAGAEGNGDSTSASISDDGRFVVFESLAANLVPGDTNGLLDVFLRDRQTGTTQRMSLGPAGAQGNGHSMNASISSDGGTVVFSSEAGNLVIGDANGCSDVFVRSRQTLTTERVSVASSGAEGDAESYDTFSTISADGRWVVFVSSAENLVRGDTNGVSDVFLRDRQAGTTERISVDSAGSEGNGSSLTRTISRDGRCVVFASQASNLVPGDTNLATDVFVHDRQGGPDFRSLCDPGVAGALACPCSNPPSGRGRGCDNSSRTGGAELSAAGASSLSSDSLVLRTSGQTPTGTSIVLQAGAHVASGAVFGQGVSCVGGSIVRLYTKSARLGGIRAPDVDAGEPSVSSRSLARGDRIQSGERRWYLVYYRDPHVPGGCPSSSTFNATQTGEVLWSY